MRIKKSNLTFLAILVAIPLNVLAVDTTSPWVSDGNVIADETYHNIEIIKVDENSYRMYYSQNGSVYSATSTKGKNWTTEEGVRVASAGQVSLLDLGEEGLRMYFTRIQDGVNVLLSATSADGLNFTEEDGIRLEPEHPKGFDSASGIVHPSVIQLYDGRYRVFYDTFNTSDPDSTWRILSAISDDGLNFTAEEGVRIKPKTDMPGDTQYVWSPYVRKKKGTYYLYFGAQYDSKPLTRNGIYLAKSQNGKDFTVNPTPLVYRDADLGKAIDTDGGMNGAPQDPFLINMNGKLRMYFWITNKGIFRATYEK